MSKHLLATFLLAIAPLAFSQRPPAGESPNAPAAEERPSPVPPETNSITDHELSLGGKTIRYSATAGTLLVDGDDEKPYGTYFYVA